MYKGASGESCFFNHPSSPQLTMSCFENFFKTPTLPSMGHQGMSDIQVADEQLEEFEGYREELKKVCAICCPS